MQSIRFVKENRAVVLVVNERRVCEIGWKPSLEICRALDQQIRNAEAQRIDPTVLPCGETGVLVGGVEFTFRQELGRILCLGAGRLLFDMNTEPTADGQSIARQVWTAWLGVTRQVEEESANPEAIAYDAAILHRAGIGIGLTDNPKIQAEAAKIADGDRDIRRFMKDRRSGRVLGAPSVKIDNRPPIVRLVEIAKSLTPEQIAKLRGLHS